MAHSADTLNYLTVQDMLWINLQVTKKVNSYHFMKLEEGTFYQYGYGASTDLMSQAARFVKGFAKNAPFADGNDMTALVGFLAFLRINGYQLDLPVSELKSALANPEPVLAKAQKDEQWHGTTREAIQQVLDTISAPA